MAGSTPNQSSANLRWLIVAMLMGFTFLGHFNRVSISVAGNEKFTKSGGMSNEQMGMVYSAFLLVYTCGMLPGGWLIDRVGPRLALTGMGLGMGFCVILTGCLGWIGLSIASLWMPLLLIRGLAGACSVPLHPAAARAVSLWVPLSNRATSNGLVTAGALIGIAVTYPGFGGLMDRVGWQMAFVICGTVMMGFALIWFQLSNDNTVAHEQINGSGNDLPQPNDSNSIDSQQAVKGFLSLFFHRNLVMLTLSYGAVSYFQYLFFYWIENYFEKARQMSVDDSRQASFIVTIAMAVGMAIGGVWSDDACRRIGRRWGYRAIAMTGMVFCAMFAWSAVGTESVNLAIALFALSLGSLGLCEGIFWTTAPVLEKERAGMACAFLNTIGNGVGLLAPMLTPWIEKRLGWSSVMAVACGACVVGAILWIWIDVDTPETQPGEAAVIV